MADAQVQRADPVAPPGAGWTPVPDPTALTNTAVTQAKDDLRRELGADRELLAERILRTETILRDLDMRLKGDLADNVNALEALLTQRINGLEQIMRILDEVMKNGPAERDQLRERLQTDIQVAVNNLQHLHEERFNAIQQQFTERDTRGEQDKKSSKEALDAALLAQKESVSQQNDANTTAATKTETNFTKQIDLVGTQITALDKSLTDRISELKERIDRGEGQDRGQDRALGSPYEASVLSQTEQAARSAQARAVMALAISGVLLIITFASLIFAVTKKLLVVS